MPRTERAATPAAQAAFGAAADRILADTVAAPGGVPGVVAMLTDAAGTIYSGTAGVREADRPAPMTADTVLAMYSCTKAVTAAAVMQLVEAGAIALTDPAERYVPEIARVSVLTGFSAAGEPIVRAPASAITVEQLLLHTAGFGYDMFNADLVRYVAHQSGTNGRMQALMSVLIFDPGTRWQYGVNLDWAGRVVEAVRGDRLDAVMRDRIFAPLGMHDTGYTLTDAMRERRATIHARAADGTLSPLPLAEPPQSPTAQTGGSGLLSTARDYLAFVRMILNDGAAPDGTRVLAPPTVAAMSTNHLGALRAESLPAAMPALTNAVALYPETTKSWGYSWMITDGATNSGRPPGTFGWAGLANLYYWIDRRNGIAGFWGTQILPFVDPASISGYHAFESAAYTHLVR